MPTVAQEIINNTLAFPKNLPCIRHISKNVNYFNPHLSLMYTVYAIQTTCNAGDWGLTPGLVRFPWRRKRQPTPAFLPGKSHGQRSLLGYSPWGRKELETT